MKAYIVMIMGMKLPSFPTKGPASRVKIWNYPTEMVLKQMFSLVFFEISWIISPYWVLHHSYILSLQFSVHYIMIHDQYPILGGGNSNLLCSPPIYLRG